MSSKPIKGVLAHWDTQEAIRTERALLGAILSHHGALQAAVEMGVQVLDFSDARNRMIWETILSLEEPIDLVTVSYGLDKKGKLKEVGHTYLASLTDVLPLKGLVPQYVKILKEASARRQLVRILEEALEKAKDPAFAAGEVRDELTARLI